MFSVAPSMAALLMSTFHCLFSCVCWLVCILTLCTCVAVCVWSPGALTLTDLGVTSMCVALGCLLESAGSSTS